MITDNLQKQIQEAMKAKDEIRLSTLKLLSASLTNAEIAKRPEKLNEEDEIKVVKGEAKKRNDAIELYIRGNALEKADKEKKELEILKEFLPEELSDEVLEGIVDQVLKETGASSSADMGKVMGFVMNKVKGQADGGRVSAIVRNKLAGESNG